MEAIESARRARRNCGKTAPRRDCSVPWKKIFVPTYRSSSFYDLLLESPEASPTSLRQKQLTCCCLVWLRLWGQPPSSLTGRAAASESDVAVSFYDLLRYTTAPRLRLTVDGRFPDLSLFPIPCLMTTLCVRQTPTSKKYKEVVIYRTMLLVLGQTTMLSIRWMFFWTLNQQTTLTTSQRS